MQRARIAVLVSGRGRNLQALIDASRDGRIPGDVVQVLCDRAGTAAVARACASGIEDVRELIASGFPARAAFDAALGDALAQARCDVIAFAGFMRVLGADFIRRFSGRMLNIHPSLLPRHPGLRTHEAVIAAGEREHGATVHFVTEALDSGPRIIQGTFMVKAQDDAGSLAERVLEEVELHIFPQAVAWLASGELRLEGAMARWRGRALEAPLTLNDLDAEFR
jgi:phosphoribosylglycinamide formyltransferase-1